MITESIWKKTSIEAPRYPPLRQDIQVDVVIIGAGITGLTAALKLKQAGRSVAVVERHVRGSGTSGSTSAHLTTLVDFKYKALIKSFGEKDARNVARSVTQAIDHIEERCRELKIDCAFQRVPGYLYAEKESHIQEVQSEFKAARDAGLAVRLIDKAPLPFPSVLAMEVDRQAQFQPMDYLNGLAQAIHGDNGAIYENTMVTDVRDGAPCVVQTEHARIEARDVVLATHTPLGINLVQTELRNSFSFVLAAKIAQELPEGLFWDTEDPYNYIRSYRRGDERSIIVGGKDVEVGHGSPQEAMQRLEDYTRKKFDVTQVETIWSAQYFDPTDGLPFIGKSPFNQHIYLGTGYGGDGLTFGTVAGLTIPNLITQNQDEFEQLYQPGRVHFSGAQNFLKKNFHVAKHFISDRILTKPPQQLEELEVGEGCVIRNGKEYIAASRQEDGRIISLSAVCPHMKCVVHWNDAERTWDCPCHGSRFDMQGQKIEGPALIGLQELGWSNPAVPHEAPSPTAAQDGR